MINKAKKRFMGTKLKKKVFVSKHLFKFLFEKL